MTKQFKRFTKSIANDIANISVSYVLEDVLYASDDGRYSLSSEAEHFEDNFVEDLELRGFIVTEYRIDIIKSCFTKQLKSIKDKVESMYKKQSDKYTTNKD
jgi:hypothetical protein